MDTPNPNRIITLTGFDAVLVAELAQRSPETVTPNGAWTSTMLHKARQLANDEPFSVRLREDARRLAEDVLRNETHRVSPLPTAPVDLASRLRALAKLESTLGFDWKLSELQRAALDLIADKLA